MPFYIKAEVQFRVRGISGPFNVNASRLVNADNREQARAKFEVNVKQAHQHMAFESAVFNYTEVADEIK
jgi:hypothetical protein